MQWLMLRRCIDPACYQLHNNDCSVYHTHYNYYQCLCWLCLKMCVKQLSTYTPIVCVTMSILIVSFLQPAFSLSPKVSLDYRTHIMNLIKTIPLDLIITYIYPKLYSVHNLTDKVTVLCNLITMSYSYIRS